MDDDRVDSHEAERADTRGDAGGRHDAGMPDQGYGERAQWYVNTVTGEPELGMKSPVTQRMGPYASREDAMRAFQIAEERNALWDAETKAWNRWGDDDGTDRVDGRVADR